MELFIFDFKTIPTPPGGIKRIPGGPGAYFSGLTLPLTWTFAGHQSPSYQTYNDVKHTSRKPAIKSTILEGQTLDLSLPGNVYKQKTDFMKTRFFQVLQNRAILRGSKAVRPGMVLTLFWIGFNGF